MAGGDDEKPSILGAPEPEPDPDPEQWDGDAPIAAPLDSPARPRTNDLRALFSESSAWQDVTASLPAPAPSTLPVTESVVVLDPRADTPALARTDLEVPALGSQRPAPSYFGPPLPAVGTDPRPPRSGSSPGRRPLSREGSRSRGGLAPPPSKPVRDYPVLRGLVEDAGRFLPVHSEDKSPVKAPVRPPPRREEPASKKVDGLLEEMADGLLVGGDGQSSEMRVTLGEDFFGGTELRISRGPDGVTAILLPPDRDSYRLLSSELPRLRAQLEQRGLRVQKLKVEEP